MPLKIKIAIRDDFNPSMERKSVKGDQPMNKEHVWINSNRNKRISAMVHKCTVTPKLLLIFCHGFTGDKIGGNQFLLYLANELQKQNFAVLRFDFSGSGESEGDFAQDTTVSVWKNDLIDVVKWVKNNPDFIDVPIILLGHSFGGTIALLYEKEKIDGVIALAPVVNTIENFRDIIIGPDLWEQSMSGKSISNFYGKGFSLDPGFTFDLIEQKHNLIEECTDRVTPLLIIHGDQDSAVPLKGSLEFYNKYKGEKDLKVINNSDHLFTNNILLLKQNLLIWLEFLKEEIEKKSI
jgi:alpha/beta superfamily hydrolase